MKKILLTIILTFQIVVLSAQNIQKELIFGTWRFEKKIDLRTENETSKFVEVIIDPIETENGTGYPDKTFKKSGEFEFYYSKIQSTNGNFEFKKMTLICWKLIPKNKIKEKPELVKSQIKKKTILIKKDGNYYFSQPIELKIKSLNKNTVEFGTEKNYSVWKRVN
jgi:transposase